MPMSRRSWTTLRNLSKVKTCSSDCSRCWPTSACARSLVSSGMPEVMQPKWLSKFMASLGSSLPLLSSSRFRKDSWKPISWLRNCLNKTSESWCSTFSSLSRRRLDCTMNSRTADTRNSTSVRLMSPVAGSLRHSRAMASTEERSKLPFSKVKLRFCNNFITCSTSSPPASSVSAYLNDWKTV
eukprot:Skav203226  [mRNA]  locus=scaffold2292:289468:303306:- [translate_table: standard]